VDHVPALLDENRAFGDLIRGADPSTPVPTCPKWNLNQLFRHVGRGHRWAAQIVADRVDYALDPRAVEGGKPPENPDDAIAWLEEGAQRLVDAVEETGFDAPVWTFIGPRPAYWWVRRRLHEVAVHRADATLALGLRYTLAPELAADGINEWLDLAAAFAGSSDQPPPLADGEAIHLHATDPGLGVAGEWMIRVSGGRITWSHEHQKGAVALRGGAADLLLAILRRIPVADTDIEILGDDAVWQRWLDQTPY
jgi:uncharacterized protein (TIGR03083 family)